MYKDSFERLRVLKPEIEHVRKIMEKSRAGMQNQFDEWYGNLHARGIDAFEFHLASQVASASESFDPRRSVEKAEAKEPYSSSQHGSTSNSDGASNSKRASGGGGVSVDDDILAFQQAKEELLKRRGAR